ncbi:hypothetical protein [Fusobacterium sp.]|uniref:hypothetical protein n=1 Tax=Fusobacterium sp. TaxID=68766 RepID=UPI002637F03B|nr:hypothetical protein [Fusobacterium sp.]
MIKKYFVLSFLILLFSSCTGVELKHLSPIPTKGNDGGILQLGKDLMTGNWERFKEKTPKEETNSFFNTPLLTENGEEVAIDNFNPKSTKDYEIQWTGIALSHLDKNTVNVDFEFGFIIKSPDKKIEYVKVQSVVPGDILTFVDESIKNGNPNPNVKVATKITNSSKDETRFWFGTVSNMPNILFTPKLANKCLFKYTIKAKGEKEVIIYQPCFLQVFILNKK